MATSHHYNLRSRAAAQLSPFLRLPLELREQIYFEIFRADEVEGGPSRMVITLDTLRSNPGILHADRQIRAELHDRLTLSIIGTVKIKRPQRYRRFSDNMCMNMFEKRFRQQAGQQPPSHYPSPLPSRNQSPPPISYVVPKSLIKNFKSFAVSVEAYAETYPAGMRFELTPKSVRILWGSGNQIRRFQIRTHLPHSFCGSYRDEAVKNYHEVLEVFRQLRGVRSVELYVNDIDMSRPEVYCSRAGWPHIAHYSAQTERYRAELKADMLATELRSGLY